MADENTDNPDNTGGGGGNEPTFQDSLGDHGTNEIFADLKDVGGLAGKAVELNTSLEELRANQPTVPENADGYTYEPADDALPVTDENLSALRDFALENKWSQETFLQALEVEQKISKDLVDAHNTKVEAATETLKKEMGDDFEPGKLLVEKVLTKFGGEGLKDRVSDLATDPDIYRLVHAFGKVLSPDVLENITVGGDGANNGKSTSEVLYDGK